MATTIGTIQLLATIDTSGYKKGAKEIENTNKGIEGSSATTSKRSNKAFESVAKVGLAAIATAAVAAGALIVKNVGGAISRIDTLNNSARVFENLGFASNDVERAMEDLVTSITGLPTRLDAAVVGVQNLAASTGDIVRGQKLFESLNNAVLGLGGTSHDVESAVLAMSRGIDRGRLQGQEWQMLLTSGLGPALANLAKQMGLTTGELQEGLSDGTISVENFEKALLDANKNGAGSMASFEKQAKDATSGIGTTWENMNAAITRGIAEVIEAIGSENIAGFVAGIGVAFESALNAIIPFIEFVGRNRNIFIPLAIAIGTVVSVLTALFVVVKLVTGVIAILNVVMLANPIGLVILAVIGLIAAFVWLWNNVEGFRNFFTGAWDKIKSAVTGVFDWVKKNWPKLLAILSGPIGLAVYAITRHFDKIKAAAQKVWNWITGAFSTIGSIGTSIIKGAVNAVLGFAERTINGFIRLINTALGAINKIPGVSIGSISELSVPKLAEGGIITSPTLAMVGEGREAEAVIPLSKLDKMINNDTDGGGQNITVTINAEGMLARSKTDLRWLGETILEAVDEARRAKGLTEINMGAKGFVGAK